MEVLFCNNDRAWDRENWSTSRGGQHTEVVSLGGFTVHVIVLVKHCNDTSLLRVDKQ